MRRYKIATVILFLTFLMLLGKNKNRNQDYKLLLQMLPTTESDTEMIISKNKTILFWGPFYDGNNFSDYCIEGDTTMDFCQYKCRYAVDQNDFNSSDAIVIHGREAAIRKLPMYRWEKQRIVFLMIESPAHTFIDISGWNDIINWTMTYRSDSDVPIPYGRIISRPYIEIPKDSHLPTLEDFRMKRLVAWASSNCIIDSSRRTQLVKQMEAFIAIDKYGRCGEELYQTCVKTQQKTNDHCTIPAECHQFLGTRYKFYLAFENSLCVEYITEKFFNALRFGMIPVVYGPDRKYYEAIGPPDSFIHVHDFSSVEALTQHLLHVGSTYEEYIKYFKWRKSYVVGGIGFLPSAWCSLCEKLHTLGDAPPKSYKNVKNWWYSTLGNVKDVCSKARLNANGTFD